jgi:hypothetical protein
MDPRNQRPLLSPLAINQDKAREVIDKHRAEAERAAGRDRTGELKDDAGPLARLVARLRALIRR